MKALNKIILFGIVFSILSCQSDENRNEVAIHGNWNFTIGENYAELFIDSTFFYYYLNSSGLYHYNYEIHEDTIFLKSESEVTKITFEIINNNMFLIKFKDNRGERVDSLYRIKNIEYTLEKYLEEKDYAKYKDAFFTRLKKKGCKIF